MFQVRRLSWRLFMSTAQGAYGGSNGGPDAWTGSWRRSCGLHPLEGFEILRHGVGIHSVLADRPRHPRLQDSISVRPAPPICRLSRRRAGTRLVRPCPARRRAPRPWSRGFSPGYTGNSAFDQWKSTEIARLEEERRKLEDAHREFADFLDNSARPRTARSSSAS